ncbi:phosphoribosylanthranilate isomerase [Weeksellaceae bacterium KMM 9713]|uniref:N-(5'-phosphoribosyl)anthranilate isomerase n=1 Tax=Profundicola chukchiensis TaxID=2961959 RepID=A0A9X4MX14_9FLAO|nr:phosphoribosylanthranilate isomerase [Profundicola chukchiensis]MDG4945097.1 phosphoribosylanthranilate isomerase [Profundicola chukchiensis]
MKIKVCGITDINQANALADLGVHFIGFISYEKSKRFAWNKIQPSVLKTLKSIKKVGVFVNENIPSLLDIAQQAEFDLIQLHGNESVEDVKEISKFYPVIKAISVAENSNHLQEQINEYSDFVSYFLFDTATKSYGGSGRTFDWDILNDLKINQPYFLSGGLSAETDFNFEAFNQTPFALDINSKFESSAGIKDIKLIESFIAKNNLIKA